MGGGRRVIVISVLMTLALSLAACGGDSESGSARTLNWFIAIQPGGALQQIADRCSEQSGGRYDIQFQLLPTSADQQREQLVRRLGAEDSSIDLIGMDIVWTGEFANARWLEPVPAELGDAVTENVFDSVLDTAQFEDRLYNVPIWSNTQLLWYREDRVDSAPETWDEMIEQAERLNTNIEVQANRYEGLVVWTNAMILSAGTEILRGPETVALEEEPTKRALATMGRLGNSPAAPANIDTSDEGSAAMGFESGAASFMVNYPFVYPSAESNAPDVFENMAAAKFPRVDPDLESKPPLGGINLGVSAFSEKKDLAFDAVRCLVQPENQLTVTELEGLPPVREDLFDRQEIQDAYPGFADVVRESIRDAGPRPSESPAYQDLSLAIQRAVHPVTEIDPQNPQNVFDRLRERVEQATEREGLL